MRGRQEPQVTMLAFVNLEECVLAEHPLRTIKALADAALTRLSPEFDRMYADVGRPSIPPERLLKASLLIALFLREERARLLCGVGLSLRTAGVADGDDLRANPRGRPRRQAAG